MRNSFVPLALVITLLHVGVAVGPTRAADPTPAPLLPAAQLAAVDALFVASYQHAVHEVLGDGPPAFLVLPDRLVLYRGRTRQEWPLIPPLFNALKTVAHVTLGLFAILSPTNGDPLGADAATALRRYQGSIGSARGAIRQVAMSPDQRDRQDAILAASQRLAERALGQGRMPDAELTSFCRQVRPLVDANIREAVRVYLDELNGRMSAALSQLDEAERTTYLVIVSGVHQARIDNAAMQYFNRLMRDPAAISQRLMYAENVFDEAGALHLLGIHRMARRVGTAYFDDPYYMNRDLFAPAAEAYVPTMTMP